MTRHLVIELCGRLADYAPQQINLDIPQAGISVAHLKARIAHDYPALATELQRPGVRLCVDETIVTDAHIVKVGATVAIFPIVSGG